MQEQTIRAQALAERRTSGDPRFQVGGTSATWLGARNHTAGRTCGATEHREARQQPSWGTRTTDDEDRHQDGQAGAKNMDKVSTN